LDNGIREQIIEAGFGRCESVRHPGLVRCHAG
jgi:hypothetical protein